MVVMAGRRCVVVVRGGDSGTAVRHRVHRMLQAQAYRGQTRVHARIWVSVMTTKWPRCKIGIGVGMYHLVGHV